MRSNKFWIGGLIEVHASSISIMRLSRQFQACLVFIIIFFRKRFHIHKNMSHLEVYAHMKNCCLYCLVLAYFCFVSWFLLVVCFCACKIFSLKKKNNKKINRLEIVLITSLYYTTRNSSSLPNVASEKGFFKLLKKHYD